jgi:formylglycine-generating enzyme required for sulfatase activity
LLPVPGAFLPPGPLLESFVAVACVSNGDYAAFVREGGPEPRLDLDQPIYRSWQGEQCPEALLDHPVLQVGQADACLFCNWLTAKERNERRISHEYEYRLPTFEQWKAWVKGDKLPEEAVTDRSWREGEQQPTLPVAGGERSALGLFHLFGNVFQWCSDEFEEDGVPHVGAVGGGWGSSRAWLIKEIRKRNYGMIWREHGLPMKDGGFRLCLCRSGAPEARE